MKLISQVMYKTSNFFAFFTVPIKKLATMIFKDLSQRIARIVILATSFLVFGSLVSDYQDNNTNKNRASDDLFLKTEVQASKTLVTAVVQMRSSRDLNENVDRIKNFIHEAAGKGARMVVFPECALTSYKKDVLTTIDANQVALAERQVADACREANIYAIIGTPYREGQKYFNSATVISPEGKIIERYHKIQLAGETWFDGGDHLSVFMVDGIPCSIIICHDERYPELVRLPVLAGAKVVFYISHESGIKEEYKISPYRAQIKARAVENSVYVVHSNAPANPDASGSHGQSRIIAPTGNIIQEASVFGEDILIAELDITKASRSNAMKSINRGPLQDWWGEGVKKVKLIGFE